MHDAWTYKVIMINGILTKNLNNDINMNLKFYGLIQGKGKVMLYFFD